MELKPGYKQTEVGVIPENWLVTQLDSLTPQNVKYGIVDGPFGSNLKTIHYRNSGIPIITSGYVTEGIFSADRYLYVEKSKFQAEKRSAVRPGDIVMAKIGERCGASAIFPTNHETGILSGNALKITIDQSRHSTQYVWQVLWHLHSSGKLEILRTVGAQPAISMANLKKFFISLPAVKAEQQAIAEALSDADSLIESLDQLIAKKRQIKQGAMQELLTGKRRLPGFSGEWEANRLGDVVEITKGQLITESSSIPGDVPVIAGGKKPAYFHNRANRTGKTVTISGSGASAGYVAFYDTPIFASDCSTIGEAKSYSVDFIYFVLLLNQEVIYKSQTGGAQPHIHPSDLRPLMIDVPTAPSEQTAIASALNDMEIELAALESRLAKARQIKQGMMQELLTGRIRLV